MVGQAIDGFGRDFAGLLLDALSLDGEGLSDVGKVPIVVEPAGGPDRARFQAPALDSQKFAEVRLVAALGNQPDVGQQSRHVVFGGE